MRCKKDDTPLRNCEDLSFLSEFEESNHLKYYLCEAYFTCVVKGSHNSQWIAYAFCDTWFDDEESIEEYEPDPSDDVQIQEDPLRPGKLVDGLPLDPRHYYLDVFATRIKRVKAEWGVILDFISDKIKSSVSTF